MQEIRHTMAEVKTETMLSRVITDKLIEAYANDDMDQQTVSMAKVSQSYPLCDVTLVGITRILNADPKTFAVCIH